MEPAEKPFFHLEQARFSRMDREELFTYLMACVDTVPDQRRVTVLFSDIEQELSDSSQLAPALVTAEEGDMAPVEYLRLGEVSEAARRTRRILALDTGTDEAEGDDPFRNAPRVHLSIPRIDTYLSGDKSVLGTSVFDRVTDHVSNCSGCGDVIEDRKQDVTLQTRSES